jgi:hypothetical protein
MLFGNVALLPNFWVQPSNHTRILVVATLPSCLFLCDPTSKSSIEEFLFVICLQHGSLSSFAVAASNSVTPHKVPLLSAGHECNVCTSVAVLRAQTNFSSSSKRSCSFQILYSQLQSRLQ